MSNTAAGYYVPHGTKWPILGSIALTLIVAGFASSLPTHNADGNFGGAGVYFMYSGFAVLTVMLFGWFGTVIRESESGAFNNQVDRSFRWGMGWFIFSEVMFFAAFFGVLLYARQWSVPWLGGAGNNAMTNALLWPGYEGMWPTNGPGEVGGEFEAMPAWGVPAMNTLILLSSGVTVTIAHWGLKQNNRPKLIMGLGATVVLGFLFLFFQGSEYIEAYHELNLRLDSGIYGTTFFMLTGFHGMHVTLGAIMLTVVFFRCLKGHFTPDHHFGFEAVSWYWHFVDVVWLGLFIFVYWLV
ncbi:MAG: cytochrome c oxidase subunit 3 [Rhodospirillales bacterium]|jgi:cytochrome c oxidase subunit 3|nr:cytochrome c oxidase subunit 3 [Rhodospirillales bacterium]